jgi:hypothetical protein
MAISRSCASSELLASCFVALKHDIAALDIARHIAITERSDHPAQLRHRDLVPTQNVDPAEQGHMSPHRLIIAHRACEGTSSTGPCDHSFDRG